MKFLRKADRRAVLLFTAATLLVVCALIVGAAVGSTHISLSRVISALAGKGKEADINIIRYVRLPRTLGGLFCGGALALAGAVIQSVLGNRLASPSVIGVNAGAGLFVTAACAVGLVGGWQLSLAAFFGAVVSTAAVSLGARKFGASGGTVILIGVALNSLLGALSDTVIALDPDVSIMNADFRIGGFSGISYPRLIPAAAIILLTAVVLILLAPQLEILTLGEAEARSLGSKTGLMSAAFLTLAALLAGAAVSVCGMLSFVGLLVPHAVRKLSGGRMRYFLPLCALFGGGFVSLCDTLSRVIFSPYEIPVGIIMAFLGAPFFLFILLGRKRRGAL